MSACTSRHRYPRPALAADYLRGGAGLLLTALPLVLWPLNPWVAAAFAAAALVFALFTARTAQRQLTGIELSDEGIAASGPLGTAIRWGELRRMKLRYFSTRRDREQGWMQLTLQGGGRRLALDSTLDGFDAVAERAALAARANRLPLDRATQDNLTALGLTALGIAPDPGPATLGAAEKGWFAELGREVDPGTDAGTGSDTAAERRRRSGGVAR